MTTKIITKYSSTAGRKPDVSNLAVGELAVNLADKKLYSKEPGGTIVEIPKVEIPKQPTHTISTASPRGGADGDIWFKV